MGRLLVQMGRLLVQEGRLLVQVGRLLVQMCIWFRWVGCCSDGKVVSSDG